MSQDVIAAVATPAGAGGIGIVRVSGGDLSPLLAEGVLLSCPRLPPRRAVHCRFLEADGAMIDEGLALYFPAPTSFTGEAVLELHAHGGMVVLQRLLARCLQLGARHAEPGEFTLRAYLNRKLDLAQAEAVADLINAGSAAAARAAARSLAGEFSAAVTGFTARLRALRVGMEGDLDFSEEDTHAAAAPASDDAAAAADIAALLDELDVLLRRTQRGARLSAGVEVVLVGAPNAGKSSLLNRLAGEAAAIVSDEPGTTRDLVERQVVIDGLTMRLTDTAGLRESGGAVEQEGVRRALVRLQNADVVLRLATAELPPPPLPSLSPQAPQAHQAHQARLLEIRNKIDLSGEAAGRRGEVHYLSAKTGEGVEALRQALCEAAGGAPQEADFSARARHVAALQAAHALLRQARGAPPEVAAAWLREADGELQKITGRYDEEDLLGDIFSTFCIGK